MSHWAWYPTSPLHFNLLGHTWAIEHDIPHRAKCHTALYSCILSKRDHQQYSLSLVDKSETTPFASRLGTNGLVKTISFCHNGKTKACKGCEEQNFNWFCYSRDIRFRPIVPGPMYFLYSDFPQYWLFVGWIYTLHRGPWLIVPDLFTNDGGHCCWFLL